jgi:hypothetical protein
MATPAAPLTLEYLHHYLQNLYSEVLRVNKRLDLLQFGDRDAATPTGHSWHFNAASNPFGYSPPGQPSPPIDPTPTPATIGALDHASIPLAATHPTTEGQAIRYSCTLVVPDSVIGHIVGRGGKGLHQVHDASGARVQAYNIKSGRTEERRVSIRGTDQQIGEALIALGNRIMRKRVRIKKKGKTNPSEEPPAPPPAPSVSVPPPQPPRTVDVSGAKAPKVKPLTDAHIPPAHHPVQQPAARAPTRQAKVRIDVRPPSPPAAPFPLPHLPARLPTPPTQVMSTPLPIPTPYSAPTPYTPDIVMGSTPSSTTSTTLTTASATPTTSPGSPMSVGAIASTGRGRGGRAAGRGGRLSTPVIDPDEQRLLRAVQIAEANLSMISTQFAAAGMDPPRPPRQTARRGTSSRR